MGRFNYLPESTIKLEKRELMFPEIEISFAEASVNAAIELHQQELEGAIKAFLSRQIDESKGQSIVCGLWRAEMLRLALDKATPKFYVHAGQEGPHLFDAGDCLATNARYKASPCAQARLDTCYMQKNPSSWLVVEGFYFPWGGAILRSIDPVEFVVATSGLDTCEDDHRVSEGVWKLVLDFVGRANREDLMRADLLPTDANYTKYLWGGPRKQTMSHPTGGGDHLLPR